MSDQIIDIVEVAIPGETGDVTPEALAAKEAAELAASNAHASEQNAEMWAGLGEAMQDGAFAAIVSNDASAGVAALNERYRLFAVPTQFGAIGDGVADDAASFQAAFDSGLPVFIPSGDYFLSETVRVTRDDMLIVFDPGARLIAGMSTTVLESTGFNNVHIEANGASIDLNELATRGVLIRGLAGGWMDGVRIADLAVSNNPGTSTNTLSAIGVLYANNVNIINPEVRDYAYTNTAGRECYGIGVHQADNVLIDNPTVDNTMIAIDVGTVTNVRMVNPKLTNTVDNGIYILGSGDNIYIENPYIDNAEEGIVILSPNTTVFRGVIKNCTNKAITARRADYGIILNTLFENNTTDIGTDRNHPCIELQIVANRFVNATGVNSIELDETQDLQIIDNTFIQASSSVSDVIRLSNARTGTYRPLIRGNTFRFPGKAPARAIRLAGGVAGGEISYNRFIEVNQAISLFGTESVPVDTLIAHNVFDDVTSRYGISGGTVAAIIENPIPYRASFDFDNVPARGVTDHIFAVEGALPSMTVAVSVSHSSGAAAPAGLIFTAWVSSNDSVTVRATNITDSAINPGLFVYQLRVM